MCVCVCLSVSAHVCLCMYKNICVFVREQNKRESVLTTEYYVAHGFKMVCVPAHMAEGHVICELEMSSKDPWATESRKIQNETTKYVCRLCNHTLKFL